MKFLAVGAFNAEVQAIRNCMKNKERALWAARNISIGTWKGIHNLIAASTGMGSLNAAASLQRYIDCYKPQYILAVGVAAALDPNIPLGQLIFNTDIHQHSTLAATQNSEFSDSIPNHLCSSPLDENFFVKLQEENNTTLKKGNIISGDAILQTIPKALLEVWLKKNIVLYDMETFAYAYVATINNLPFLSFRMVSDYIRAEENADNSEHTSPPSAKGLRGLLSEHNPKIQGMLEVLFRYFPK